MPSPIPLPRILSQLLRSTARNQTQGMSLAEMAIAFLFMGIFASLAAPNLVGIYNSNLVKDGFNDLSNAIREAQARAVQSSRSCTVTMGTSGTRSTVTAANAQGSDCVANRVLPDGVAVSTNFATNPPNFTFSFKGNTTTQGTIVVYWANQPTLQPKCLTISNGVGIIRQGNYTGNPTNAVTAGNCQTTS